MQLNLAILNSNPFPLPLFSSHFTIGYLKLPAILNCFSFPLRVWDSGVQLYYMIDK